MRECDIKIAIVEDYERVFFKNDLTGWDISCCF